MSRLASVLALCAALLLSGCAAISLNGSPGRDKTIYADCLAVQGQLRPNGATTSDGKIAVALGNLLEGMANGGALTRDQFGGTITLTRPLLSGAAPNRTLVFEARDVSVELTAAAKEITANELRALEDSAFNEFLDCYLGPVDKIDYEARLLRGHMALAMVAAYMADVVKSAPTTQRAADAQRGLHLLQDAELDLEVSSPAMLQLRGVSTKAGKTPPSTIDVHTRYVANVERVLAIIAASSFADEVYAQDLWSHLSALITDVATKLSINPYSAARTAAAGAVSTFAKMAVYENFGAAYFGSAHYTLARVSPITATQFADTSPAPVVVDAYETSFAKTGVAAWQEWDAELSDSCLKLAALAGSSKQDCLPTGKQLYEQLPAAFQAFFDQPKS